MQVLSIFGSRKFDSLVVYFWSRFLNTYSKGLTSKQAAWASKKYRGHRVLPESLMDDLEKTNL
ncbi:hypothetical protein OG21DRAFT_1409241 [Imleria badia]|nr:hypothetical protein OG21DRAFT_1409241 [Imleria badia]